jgi:hypothetical protein
MDKTSNDTLIALFEMLNERLHKIEEGNNTLINCLKNKCVQESKLDKNLFCYPFNVNIYFHDYCAHKSLTLNEGNYAYISLSDSYIENRIDDSYYPMYSRHYDKVRPLLEARLTKTQLQKLDTHQRCMTIHDVDMKCEELGINDINLNVHEYIANMYIKSKYDMVELIVLNITESSHDIIIKNASTIDDVVQCTCNVFNDLCLPLNNPSVAEKVLFVTICPSEYWLNIELLINNIDSKHVAKHLNLGADIICQYRDSVEYLIKYKDKTSFEDKWWLDEDAVEENMAICIFNDLLQQTQW